MKRRLSFILIILILMIVSSLWMLPVSAQTATWTGQYFNNKDLTGSPVLTLSESSPTHNWGAGSPGGGLGTDNFSARWTANIALDGTYQIDVVSDDGVRVFFNNQLVINEWHDATGLTYSHTFSVSSGTYPITVEYYENGGDAFITFNLTLTSGSVPTATPTLIPGTGGAWTAQYFNSIDLSGTPVLTQSIADPTFNSGLAAPVAGLNTDNFSARFSTNQTLNGTYTLEIFADDGVRVWINGVNVINEWHDASPFTFSHTFSLPNGTYPIVIEYYENGGGAFLTYSLRQGAGIITNPTFVPPPSSPVALVDVLRLNVRNFPSTETGSILTRVHLGESYPIVGRNADSSWYEITVGSVRGWVFGQLVVVVNSTNVPVTLGNPVSLVVQPPTTTTTTTTAQTIQPPPPASGIEVHVRANLNIRKGPGVDFPIINRIQYLETANLLGRNVSGTWLYVQYKNSVGWVSILYAILPYNLNLSQIPVR